MKGRAGRVLYGAVFLLLLPLLLAWWARAAESNVALPRLHHPRTGIAVAAVGAALLLSAWHALWRFGGGLPMNAFPPRHHVARGIYRWLADPIYIGAVLISAGVSIAVGSSAGLWLVSPALAAGCAALVIGYERLDLRRRFGVLPPVLIALPPPEDAPPRWHDHLSVWLLVLAPWLLVYTAIIAGGPVPGSWNAYFPFERSWPVIEWTEALYASAYPVVLLMTFLLPTRRAIRRFAVAGIVLTIVLGGMQLVVPLSAPPRAFEPTTALGRLLAMDRAYDELGRPGGATFPAFHAGWALLCGLACFTRGRIIGAVGAAWAALNGASCITTGMHALIDVLAAVPIALLSWHAGRAWHGLLRCSERLANSVRAWRLGPVRILSHAAWSFMAGFVGAVLLGLLLGRAAVIPVTVTAIGGIVGAGLWLQFVLRGSGLSRPFGYHGFAIGAGATILLIAALGGPGWPLFAALAVAAPLIQAIGRLRCLVQGCCHGSETGAAAHGIIVVAPQSRVCWLAGLRGRSIYPTPVYSILANVACTPILLRLWMEGAPCSVVGGVALVLAGVTRFAEESYRCEPKAPRFGGLHIFHWAAMLSVITGAILTTLHAPPAAAVDAFGWSVFPWAMAVGTLFAFAMSVDFPDADRRFARLAPVEVADSSSDPP